MARTAAAAVNVPSAATDAGAAADTAADAGAAAVDASGPAIEAAYARLGAATDEPGRVAATAALLLTIFDDFYRRLCDYPFQAKRAFEARDVPAAVRVSAERLQLYSRYIASHGPRIAAAYPGLGHSAPAWDALDERFCAMIVERYEADIAFSFVHSMRRNIAHELWRPVAYSFPPPGKHRAFSMKAVHRRLPLPDGLQNSVLGTALQAPLFAAPFADLPGDLLRLRARLDALFSGAAGDPDFAGARPLALDVVDAGFYRDRIAVVVGRWVLEDGRYLPFVVGLRNGPAGIEVEALLHRTADIHDLFSSALANFHVTTRLYYQTCRFLFSLMPLRPLGQHYSTIGFNHVGKVAILNEMLEQMRRTGQRFRRSPGTPGTVAIGFTYDDCSYHLKIIRDQPTKAYKWGAYPGLAAVVDKYRVVHEINRASSMLDNVIYFHLRLDQRLFDPELLQEILAQAAGSAQIDGDGLLLRSLIVQLKIVPLPVYLESASDDEMRAVMANLGRCIRNNAATNIFNRDLDSRNYGVGRYGRVLLFDYDAVEPLTGVKIRTNRDREPGEDAPPDWFFEDGTVFLPEELEVGMLFHSRAARQAFREVNADLLEVAYWRELQERLARGEHPELSVYPEHSRLR